MPLGMEFPLHPPFLAPVLVGCLIAALIQWILVLYFGTRSRVLGSLDRHPTVTALRLNQSSSNLRAVPFVRDSFFILWNLLPFAFGIPYLFLYYHDWGDIYAGLSLHFTNVKDFYDKWIGAVLFSPVLRVGISIVSVNTPLSDTLIHGETGLAIPAKDPQKLAEAILYFANNPIEIKRMGANARQLAISNFDPATNAKRLLEVYNRVVFSKRNVK